MFIVPLRREQEVEQWIVYCRAMKPVVEENKRFVLDMYARQAVVEIQEADYRKDVSKLAVAVGAAQVAEAAAAGATAVSVTSAMGASAAAPASAGAEMGRGTTALTAASNLTGTGTSALR